MLGAAVPAEVSAEPGRAPELAGLRSAQPGVKPDRFFEMELGLIGRASCLMREGQTVMRAGLLVKAACLLGQITRDDMLEQSLLGPPHGQEHFAKTVERFGFTDRVVTLAKQ